MPYIGNKPGTGVRSRFIYTATASQTTFSGADDNSKTLKYADSNYIDVYLNGVCLVPGTDYTASTKTSVVLTQAASVSDILKVIAYDVASMDDSISKADGGTFNGDLGITNASPDLTLTNNTTEDTDGGRESTVTFKGLQSGGEESTLAEIRASHDATADDQKGDLIFKTNDGSDNAAPTEAMRIQSDQSVLFGSATTDDDQKIQMIKTGGSVGLGLHSNRAAAGGSALILSHNRNTSIGSFTALNDNDQLGRITFQGSDGADIKTEGAQIHAEINGTVGSNDLPTDLVFSTTADGASSITERMRILESGGITFNGDTAAANALNDYEEGTWTPVLGGSTSTSGQSYSIQAGSYTKIGNTVNAHAYISLANVGTVSGSYAYIMGFPFNVSNNNGSYPALTIGYFAGLGQNVSSLGGYLNKGTPTAYVTFRQGAGVSIQYISAAAIGTASIIMSITYNTEA